MGEVQPQFEAVRNAEQERRASRWERRYGLLLESLPEAVYTQDEAGNLIAANAAGEHLSGFSRQELLRLNIRELLPPEFHEMVTALLQQAKDGQRQFSAAAELIARDGSRRPVAMHASILCDPGWPLAGAVPGRELPPEKRAKKRVTRKRASV